MQDIWILFSNCLKKARNFSRFLKPVRDFAFPISEIWLKQLKVLYLIKRKKAFYAILFPMMEQNMQRLSDDLDWFCDKFDYRNKDADWRTSKDALPRGMQKAAGGYPADEPYTMDK